MPIGSAPGTTAPGAKGPRRIKRCSRGQPFAPMPGRPSGTPGFEEVERRIKDPGPSPFISTRVAVARQLKPSPGTVRKNNGRGPASRAANGGASVMRSSTSAASAAAVRATLSFDGATILQSRAKSASHPALARARRAPPPHRRSRHRPKTSAAIAAEMKSTRHPDIYNLVEIHDRRIPVASAWARVSRRAISCEPATPPRTGPAENRIS